MSTADRSFAARDFDKGMNNLVPDSELSIRVQDRRTSYLRDIVNADLLHNQIKRRRGTQQALAGTACRGAFSALGMTLMADGANLKLVSGAGATLSAVTIYSGLAPTRRVVYAAGPTTIFVSDGALLLEVATGGVIVPRAEPPAGATHDPLTPLPGGDILAYLNGQLFVAQGSVLYYSEPYMPRHYHAGRNFIPFSEPLTMVEPCQNGLYVGADQTYWIEGDLTKASLNPVLPYGVVRGTSGQVPNSNSCYWFSHRGAVVGSQTGAVKNLQEETVAVAAASTGAAMFREEDGIKQIVASVTGSKDSVMSARSFMDADVIRKETT